MFAGEHILNSHMYELCECGTKACSECDICGQDLCEACLVEQIKHIGAAEFEIDICVSCMKDLDI